MATLNTEDLPPIPTNPWSSEGPGYGDGEVYDYFRRGEVYLNDYLQDIRFHGGAAYEQGTPPSTYYMTPNGLQIIPWAEKTGSPRESYAGGAYRISRTIHCAWENRWPLMQQWVGYSLPLYNSEGKAVGVSRVIPKSYKPLYRFADPTATYGDPYLWCTSIESCNGIGIYRVPAVDIRRQDNSPGRPAIGMDFYGSEALTIGPDKIHFYDRAEISFNFETLPYGVVTDEDMIKNGFIMDGVTGEGGRPVPDESLGVRYVTRHYQPNVEHLTVAIGQMVFGDGKKAVNGQGRLSASAEIQFTWHEVPGLPPELPSLLGKVNSKMFYYKGPRAISGDPDVDPLATTAYPRGTLLLLGVEIRPYRSITGRLVLDIVYKMKHFHPGDEGGDTNKPIGHNHILRFKPEAVNTTGQAYVYEKVYAGSPQGQEMYEYGNFDKLFRLS